MYLGVSWVYYVSQNISLDVFKAFIGFWNVYRGLHIYDRLNVVRRWCIIIKWKIH